VSNKAECPACKAWPSCGLPGSAIAEIYAARKRKADADLTAQLEEALIRAGKAEGELARLRRRAYEARKLFADWEQKDPLSSGEWERASWLHDDD
jgi:hypothetical protein